MNRSGSKRWTVQYKRTNERERVLEERITRALRRIKFDVEPLTQYDKHGVRCNGVNLRASKGGYAFDVIVVLPGHTPDTMQRAYRATCETAVYICAPDQALACATCGLLTCDGFGRNIAWRALPKN